MCDPIPITMAALSAAGAGASIYQSQLNVEDAKRRRALGYDKLQMQKGQLDLRSLQEASAAAVEIERVRADALQAMGTAQAGMASQLGGGASYDAVIQALKVGQAKEVSMIEKNLDWTQQSIEQQKASMDLDWLMQPTIFEQSDLASALQIATAATSGYAQGQSFT